jgi:hypothetical protein
MRPTQTACFFLLTTFVLALPACKDTEPTGCRIALQSELTSTALSQMPNVRLDRAGDGFVLIGVDEAGNVIRFAALSEAGVVGPETTFMVPARMVGPFYAVAGKNTPGDQLLVVVGVAKEGVPNQIEMQVVTLDAGAAAPAPPKPLRDSMGRDLLPAGAPLGDLRVAMGTSKTGLRAALAWGFERQGVAPKVVVLGPDGEIQGNPVEARNAPPNWECLDVVSSRTDFGLSLIVPPKGEVSPMWYIGELKDDAGSGLVLHVPLTTKEVSCPAVTPSPRGYAFAWQTVDGTFFGEVDVTMDPPPVAIHIVKGAVRFGGPQKQPPVACVASMEKDFALAYAALSGPQIDRFNVFGTPRGASLYLPTAGRVAGISGWSTHGAMFLTYLDQTTSAAGGVSTGNDLRNQRYLIKVMCPAEF